MANIVDDEPFYFDAHDRQIDIKQPSEAYTLKLDVETLLSDLSHSSDEFIEKLPYRELVGYSERMDTYAFGVRAASRFQKAEELQPYLGFRPLEVIRRTLENSTQLASQHQLWPIKKHVQSRDPGLNRK